MEETTSSKAAQFVEVSKKAIVEKFSAMNTNVKLVIIAVIVIIFLIFLYKMGKLDEYLPEKIQYCKVKEGLESKESDDDKKKKKKKKKKAADESEDDGEDKEADSKKCEEEIIDELITEIGDKQQ